MSEEMYDGAEESMLPEHDMMEMFETLSFREKWSKVFQGLKCDKASGEYKYARLQMIRLSGPAAAVVVPVLFMGLLILFAAMTPDPPVKVQVEIMEPEAVEELEEIEEPEPEEIEPPEPMEIDEITPDIEITNPNPAPETDFSPIPSEVDAVAMVKSPLIMKGIYGSRNPGARGQAMKNYGGSGLTEGAVMRALRWLKKNQSEDGSWGRNSGGGTQGQESKPAHTSVALLAYLAHGETPASEEFGATVEKAIKYLVSAQTEGGHFQGKDGHDYTQPICAYALSEAYALTKVPMLKDAAVKAVDVVVKGQMADGRWDYNCKSDSTRGDTSYMGWCAQALKAAKMAGLTNEGLDEAYKKAPEGFKKNYKAGDSSTGYFGYTGPNKSHNGLTGVGVLCMQLTGAGKSKEVSGGLAWIRENHVVKWDGEGKGRLYYWYYDTQAMFHVGGDTWNYWNNMFAVPLVKAQTVIKDAIADPKGDMQDIGYWTPSSEKANQLSRSFRTCLAALSLQVYYRYLPTYKPPQEEKKDDVAADDDIEIEVSI